MEMTGKRLIGVRRGGGCFQLTFVGQTLKNGQALNFWEIMYIYICIYIHTYLLSRK